MTEQNTKPSSTDLKNILEVMNALGKYPIAVITDMDGFPIAAAARPGEDPAMQSAVVALIQKTASQVRGQLGMAQTDEVTVYDTQGQRLVCRPFEANNHEMILAILIPEKKQSYRFLTNNTISKVKKLWDS